MNYTIHSDLPSELPIPLPEMLSQFFEQYSGFGEESEVGQTEVILDVDLSIFQKYNLRDAKNILWLDVKEAIRVTKELLDRVQAKPDFYKAIQYGGVPGSVFRKDFLAATAQRDDKKLADLVKRWQNTPDSSFPPDTGYIRDGRLATELTSLVRVFEYLDKRGAKKFYFDYR